VHIYYRNVPFDIKLSWGKGFNRHPPNYILVVVKLFPMGPEDDFFFNYADIRNGRDEGK
jgi:hypothetical protein